MYRYLCRVRALKSFSQFLLNKLTTETNSTKIYKERVNQNRKSTPLPSPGPPINKARARNTLQAVKQSTSFRVHRCKMQVRSTCGRLLEVASLSSSWRKRIQKQSLAWAVYLSHNSVCQYMVWYGSEPQWSLIYPCLGLHRFLLCCSCSSGLKGLWGIIFLLPAGRPETKKMWPSPSKVCLNLLV